MIVVRKSDIITKTYTVVCWVCPICGRELRHEKLNALVVAIKKHCLRKHNEDVEFRWGE